MMIGTRGSALARTQTEYVRALLQARFPDLLLSVRIIRTSADRDTATSIRSGSAVGVFVKELEQALLRGEIDLAVHSMKDLPTRAEPGLCIAAIPEREDARDALVCRDAGGLELLPPGALVGTGSVRRQAQLLALRADLAVADIRGNIDTRLNRLHAGDYAALVLACAGLNRLGYRDRISEALNCERMLPAPGQGALAIQMRADDPNRHAVAAAVHHLPTAIAVGAERSFLRRMGGGCNVPVAAYADIEENRIRITGLAAAPDGSRVIRESVEDFAQVADEAGAALAGKILARGGSEILRAL